MFRKLRFGLPAMLLLMFVVGVLLIKLTMFVFSGIFFLVAVLLLAAAVFAVLKRRPRRI